MGKKTTMTDVAASIYHHNLDRSQIHLALTRLAEARGISVAEAREYVIRTGLRRLAAAVRNAESRAS